MLNSRPDELPSAIAEALRQWLLEQRWWPGDSYWASATVIDLTDQVQIWLLRTPSGVTVQVPLICDVVEKDEPSPATSPDSGVSAASNVVSFADYSRRRHGQPEISAEPEQTPGLIATVTVDDADIAVIDATHDERFHRAVLEQLRIVEPWLKQSTNRLLIPDDIGDEDTTAGTPTARPGVYPPELEDGRRLGAVLAVEQSNTSIIMPRVHHGVIVKVLRCVVDGAQPDLDVPNSLAAAGFAHVPRTYAVLESKVDDGRFLAGWQATLAIVSQLVTDAEDGFTRACAMAAGDLSATTDLRTLGADLAEMHTALRRAFPAEISSLYDVIDALEERFEDSASRCDQVRELLGPIDTYLDAVRRQLGDEPVTVQRLHGDLHLGQTLWSPHGWWVLDFEGEPLRPLAARILPDLPERDVAGMLRSVDYAAAISDGSPAWASQARDALLTGYFQHEPAPTARYPRPDESHRRTLIETFELDKAAYEVGYEQVHRPHWQHIPLAAMHRILAPYL